MPSQKSIPSDTNAAASEAVPPKRQRGRLRVAAILVAASDMFLEKGFDGTTMTEIAARSGTAIGSLYRFFPTKEVLADALLGQYVAKLEERLSAIAIEASRMEPAALADSLIDMAVDLLGDRSSAVILVEARRDGPYRSTTVREFMRGRIGALVRLTAPSLPAEQVPLVATTLLQLLKSVPVLVEEERAGGQPMLGELRRAARLYAGDALSTWR
jgi:AcrR family transcriptional regulator